MQISCTRDIGSAYRAISFNVVSRRNRKNQFCDETARDLHRDIKSNSRFLRQDFHGGKLSGDFLKLERNKKLAWADNLGVASY